MLGRIVQGIQPKIRPGLHSSINGSSKGYPLTPGDLRGGVTAGLGNWVSIWPCQDASGSLRDMSGGISLAPISTPVYRQPGPGNGRYAVGADSAADAFEAALNTTYDLDANAEIAILFALKIPALPGGVSYLINKFNATGYIVYVNAAGNLVYLVQGAVGVVNAGIGLNFADNQWHYGIFSISRGAVQRVRINVDGNVIESDSTGMTTLTNTAKFRLGAGAGSTVAHTFGFAAVSTTDVQSIRTNDTAIITNFKRYIGV